MNRLIILICLSLLSACSTSLLQPYQKSPQSSESFQLSGVIAAKNQAHGWIAQFHWLQQHHNDYQIMLNGPLGSESIEISMHHGLLNYHQGKRQLSSQDPETLLAKETGIRLPLNHLYYWIRGKPAPGPAFITRNPTNPEQIVFIKQAGFGISYGYGGNNSLPKKIRLEKDKLLIKIVIHHWGIYP